MSDIRQSLRAVPSSLSDACRTMEAAADQMDMLIWELERLLELYGHQTTADVLNRVGGTQES